MPLPFRIGSLHHVRLTVSDIERSRAFYEGALGLPVAVELPPSVIFSLGEGQLLGLTPPFDPSHAPAQDRFSEHRVGLDHLSLSVDRRADLDSALAFFDEQGIPHGEITDLGPDFGVAILEFRDPDNIQLELTAPRE